MQHFNVKMHLGMQKTKITAQISGYSDELYKMAPTMWTFLSSFLGLEVLFSHSSLGTLPLNNEESIECGKHGVCEGFHEVL